MKALTLLKAMLNFLATILIKKQILRWGILILFLALVTTSVYFYRAYRTLKDNMANPILRAQEGVKEWVPKVGKLMALPDENPTVATVTDVEKLKDQQFFANAANGDIVLFYASLKKAILYRPSLNKIIDVSILTLASKDQTATPSAQATESGQKTQ